MASSPSKPAITPNRWQPPTAPARAREHTGPTPVRVNVIDLPGHGPEDVVVDAAGNLLAGLADGRIVRVTPDTSAVQTVADTGGRPLGLCVHPDGSLIVCDSQRGLLRVDLDSGQVQVLVDRIDGQPMVFCSNCVVASDGTIYFTESSQHVGVENYMADILEHSNTGRLSRLDPDGSVHVLVDGLKFANGLVLAADESWIAVAETSGYRITKVPLTGATAGPTEPLVENLPGFPDNMSRGSDGLIWVALATPRDPLLDFLLPRAPLLRRLVWALPAALRPGPKKMVWLQAYDDAGKLVHDLQTPHDRFYMATGVVERNGQVWAGCLTAPTLARIEFG